MNNTLLLINHDKRFTAFTTMYLHNRGYRLLTPDNRETMLQLYRTAQPDIVLVHENYPDLDVLLSLRTIQSDDKYIPIILIVSNPEIANAVSAFHLCVSDCVMIDIQAHVLIQRIRRCLTTLAPEKPKIPLGSQALYLPNDFQILCRNEERIDLLHKENQLLGLLTDNMGEICYKHELMSSIWASSDTTNKYSDDYWQTNLHVLVSSLRKKLQPLNELKMDTIRKIGIRLTVHFQESF